MFTGFYQALDHSWQIEFSWVFNFTILSTCGKFDAHGKYVLQYFVRVDVI